MRQRKHPRPNQRKTQAKKSAPMKSSPVRYRRQRLTRITMGIIILMLISFIGMSYTNKVDGWLPSTPKKAKAPATQPAAPTTTAQSH